MSTIDFLFWATGKAVFIAILITIGIWLFCLCYKYRVLGTIIELLREQTSEEQDASLDWVDAGKVKKVDGCIQRKKQYR